MHSHSIDDEEESQPSRKKHDSSGSLERSKKSKSQKRRHEEAESKDNGHISKKIKTDHKKSEKKSNHDDLKQSSISSSKHHNNLQKAVTEKSSSSSKSKYSSSSSKKENHIEKSSSSQPARIQTPQLLIQKPKQDLSPDILNELNVSTSDFLPPPSKLANREQPSMQSQSLSQPSQSQIRVQSESDILTKSITSIKSRTRIFSGNSRVGSKIPKLYDMCLKVLADNLDYVGQIGGVPFDILRPALEKAKANQLTKIEYYNPYLLDESDILWKTICQRKWRNRQPIELESWREMYERCNREDEEKLNRLTKSIRKTQEKTSNNVQKTKMAFVDVAIVTAPKRVAIKQEQVSTTKKPVMSLAARIENLRSAKPKFVMPGNIRDEAQPIVRRGTVQGSNLAKPAPMMAKLMSKFKR